MFYRVWGCHMAQETKQYTVEAYNGTTVTIPDGKWVCWVSTHSYHCEEWNSGSSWEESGQNYEKYSISHTYKVVGVEPQEKILLRRTSNPLHERGYSRSEHSAIHLLVGDEPFGLILESYENDVKCDALWFVAARQIHKGELGRMAEVERPKFAHEAMDSLGLGKPKNRRQRRRRARSKKAWARLSDVARLIEMEPEDVVRRYLPFSGNGELHDHPYLRICFAKTWNEVNGRRQVGVEMFSYGNLYKLLERNLETAWIEKGLTLAILRLYHLGYVPEPVTVEVPSISYVTLI